MSRRLQLLALIGAVAVAMGAVEIALFATMGPRRAVFVQVAGLGVLMALVTVLARNLVHAALALTAFFFLVACTFVLLEVEFLAAMQVLVYVGAVAILLMFGIMLTRDVRGDVTMRMSGSTLLGAGSLSLATLAALTLGILSHGGSRDRAAWADVAGPPVLAATDPREAVIRDMAPALGLELMGRWGVAFELAGVLLTAAVVGAVALARPLVEAAPPVDRARPPETPRPATAEVAP